MLKRVRQVILEAVKNEPPSSAWSKFFWAAVAFALVLPVATVVWGRFSLGALAVLWIWAGIFIWVALKLRKRARRGDHRASVTHVVEDRVRSYYYAMCDCGWIEAPIDSRTEAFAAAHKHSKRVEDEVAERVVGTS